MGLPELIRRVLATSGQSRSIGEIEFHGMLATERSPALAYSEVVDALAHLDIKLTPEEPEDDRGDDAAEASR